MWIVSHRASVRVRSLTPKQVTVHPVAWKTKAGKTVRWALFPYSSQPAHSVVNQGTNANGSQKSYVTCELRSGGSMKNRLRSPSLLVGSVSRRKFLGQAATAAIGLSIIPRRLARFARDAALFGPTGRAGRGGLRSQ